VGANPPMLSENLFLHFCTPEPNSQRPGFESVLKIIYIVDANHPLIGFTGTPSTIQWIGLSSRMSEWRPKMAPA
jgi:hypothetical protein